MRSSFKGNKRGRDHFNKYPHKRNNENSDDIDVRRKLSELHGISIMHIVLV